MLAVGSVLAFAGVFGGYVAAAETALLLAFVLAVSIPATVSAIPTRVAGWMLAGAIATLAGVFFWPWFERQTLRTRAAEACLAVAALAEALRSTCPRTSSPSGATLHALPFRPSATNTRAARCGRPARPAATAPSSS